jgi:hypothetical protein
VRPSTSAGKVGLGGSLQDEARALAFDVTGAVTVGGRTLSSDFPWTPGAYDTTFNSQSTSIYDAFVTRLSPSGGGLLYSTFLGGLGPDVANALALDTTGAATVAGSTQSLLPTTPGAYDTTFNGAPSDFDAFVARLSPAGTALFYSTYLGGSMGDGARSVALDATGAATVAGETVSPGFPTTPGAYDTSQNGTADGFVASLDLLPMGASAYGTSTPGCTGPLAIGVTAIPSISLPLPNSPFFALTCGNAPPNTTGLLAFSGAALAMPIVFLGAEIWIDLASPAFFTVFVPSNSIGASEVLLPISNVPALVGQQVFAQFFWFGPSAPSPPCPPGGISASNALAITVQP